MKNRFSKNHCDFLNAEDGAFSRITKADEATKKQITLTGYEKNIVLKHFGKANIFCGRVRDKSGKGRKVFINHNTGKEITLGLVFPKLGKTEIRLYMNEDFKGTADDVWYIFKREKHLYVGLMPAKQWDSISFGDFQDDLYQQSIQDYENAPASKKSYVVSSYSRNPVTACKALKKAKFTCEIDSGHTSFLTKKGKPYMEAHHLIPMSLQEHFTVSLDVVENIVCPCPNCHRLVHHAKKEAKIPALKKLYSNRTGFFQNSSIDITLEALTKMYQ